MSSVLTTALFFSNLSITTKYPVTYFFSQVRLRGEKEDVINIKIQWDEGPCFKLNREWSQSHDPPWPLSFGMTPCQCRAQPCFPFYDPPWPPSFRMTPCQCRTQPCFSFHNIMTSLINNLKNSPCLTDEYNCCNINQSWTQFIWFCLSLSPV